MANTIKDLQEENNRLRQVIDILTSKSYDDNFGEVEEEFDESQLEEIDNTSNKAEGKSGK